MPQRQSYQDKITISAVIFLALAFCLYYFLISPSFARVENIKAQIDQQNLQAENNYKQGQDLKKLTENIKVVEPRLGEIEQVFIKKDDPSSFITSLEGSMAKNNVSEISAPLFGAETQLGKYYTQIPLDIYVRGSAPGLIGFINDLEKQQKYINLNSLQMTVISSETAGKTMQKIISAQISANTYWGN